MKSVYNYFKYQQVDIQCTCENIPVVDMNLAAKISINRSHNGGTHRRWNKPTAVTDSYHPHQNYSCDEVQSRKSLTC